MGMTCLFAGDASGDAVDVDKTWQLLHYLLTGRAEGGTWPLSFILPAETAAPDAGEAGDRDDERWDDDGPPGNHFSAEQVREIAAALAPLTPEVAQARWPGRTPAAEEVYLYDDDDSAAEAAMAYYGELRDLVLRLAERGEGLVVTLI